MGIEESITYVCSLRKFQHFQDKVKEKVKEEVGVEKQPWQAATKALARNSGEPRKGKPQGWRNEFDEVGDKVGDKERNTYRYA